MDQQTQLDNDRCLKSAKIEAFLVNTTPGGRFTLPLKVDVHLLNIWGIKILKPSETHFGMVKKEIVI